MFFPQCVSVNNKLIGLFSIFRFPRSDPRNSNYLASFLAPEILTVINEENSQNANNKPAYNEATDSFAFGSLLYEMFTEVKPFLGLSSEAHAQLLDSDDFESLFEHRTAEIPAHIQKIITHCWRRDPTERPAFSHIVEALSNRTPLRFSRHSFSQPDLFDLTSGSAAKSKPFRSI